MEKTKRALKKLLKLERKVVTAMEDKHISAGEAIGMLFAGIGIKWIFKNLPDIEAEILARTDDDMKALNEQFKAEFDLPNYVTEAKIESGVKGLLELGNIILPRK